MLKHPKSLAKFTWDTYWRFNDHDGWAIASHVALTALLALFPFLIFVTAVASLLGTPAAAKDFIDLTFEGWPAPVAQPLANEVMRVLTGRRSDLLTIGIALTLWTASSGVEAGRVALTRAYSVPDHRAWYMTRLQSIGLVLVGAAAFLVLVVAVVLWPALWEIGVSHVPELRRIAFVTDLVRFGLTSAFLVLALVLAHILLPPAKLRVRDVWPGIVLTLVLWLASASVFGYWLGSFSNYASTYAGLGSVMAALFFLYILSVAFIAGGELNAALIDRRTLRIKPSAKPQRPAVHDHKKAEAAHRG